MSTENFAVQCRCLFLGGGGGKLLGYSVSFLGGQGGAEMGAESMHLDVECSKGACNLGGRNLTMQDKLLYAFTSMYYCFNVS